jgi:hypothetical protein
MGTEALVAQEQMHCNIKKQMFTALSFVDRLPLYLQ